MFLIAGCAIFRKSFRQSAYAEWHNVASPAVSKIEQTLFCLFQRFKVPSVQLNVSVSVGTRIPDSVQFYPLPEEAYVIYPEWRGFDYILVGDQIVVLDPRTHEIVAILDA